jgi:hypothetical protein
MKTPRKYNLRMKLYIPAKDAIELLKRKLSEIDGPGFNSEAWKASTANELKEIFSPNSVEWLQVSQVKFDTYITSQKIKTLKEGKDTARKLLKSYIESIQRHLKITGRADAQTQNNSKTQYQVLHKAYLTEVEKCNTLQKDNLALTKEYNAHLAQSIEHQNRIKALQDEVNRLKENTIQWNNIKIGKLLKHITWKQMVVVIGAYMSVGGAGYGIGHIIERNSNKVEIHEFQVQHEKDKSIIEAKDSDLKLKRDSLVDCAKNTVKY